MTTGESQHQLPRDLVVRSRWLCRRPCQCLRGSWLTAAIADGLDHCQISGSSGLSSSLLKG
jgi:hypothetical protein